MKELILLKVMIIKDVLFVIISFSIMVLTFKILSVMVVMMSDGCALVLVILLLSLLKMLIIVASFKIFASLKQFICQKILCLIVVGIYKVHVHKINIKNMQLLL